MSKRERGLTEDERKLWRRVAARVKPRRVAMDEEAPTPPPLAKPRVVSRKTALTPPPPKSAPAPQNRGAEKRVRRGRVEIGGTLDLHGHTQSSARAALKRFLFAASRRGARTVIVITGVGRTGEGVLKKRLPEWLAETEFRSLVSGFAKAHRTHGGEGAFYVFLRRPADMDQ